MIGAMVWLNDLHEYEQIVTFQMMSQYVWLKWMLNLIEEIRHFSKIKISASMSSIGRDVWEKNKPHLDVCNPSLNLISLEYVNIVMEMIKIFIYCSIRNR